MHNLTKLLTPTERSSKLAQFPFTEVCECWAFCSTMKTKWSLTKTLAPKFEWCDSLHKFTAIVDRKSEGNWSFSTLLTLALLMFIFLTVKCVNVICDVLRWRRQTVVWELSFNYEQIQLWKHNIALPYFNTQIRE